jgi:hypothetical protein
MWPLSLLLFVATAAPPQQPLNASQDFLASRLPAVQLAQPDLTIIPKVIDDTRRNTCYTMRSYFFRRQDGQTPVPAGMTTCTPASVSQQRQVASPPTVKFVPLGATRNDDQ